MLEVTVSFIIPVYNVDQYLSACIDSVLEQSLDNYEIILINDGSTDNSLIICREYEKKYPQIRVIDQLNSGVATARNLGIHEAKGKYICFMDSDDYYTCDFAKDFYYICEKERLDVIRGFYRYFDEDTDSFREEPTRNLSYFNQVLSGEEFLVKSMKEHANEVVPVGGFFRRDHLINNNIKFPEGIIFEEDQIFFLESLIKKPSRVMQTNVEFYAYRKRAGSATTTPTLKKAEDVGKIVSLELELANKMNDKEARRAAKRYAGSSFFQLTCIYGRLPKEHRKVARQICNLSTKLSCVMHAANLYQQIKIALFTLAPSVVDFVYFLKEETGY